MPTNSAQRRTAYLFLIISAIIWGVAPSIIKLGLNDMPPFNFLFIRFLVTSIALLPFFIIQIKKHKISLNEFSYICILGILEFTISLSFFFVGIERTTSIDASLLGALNPIIVVVLGYFLLKEMVSKQEKLGTAVAFFGSIIIIIQPIAEAFGAEDSFWTGEGFAGYQIIGNALIIGYLIFNSLHTVLTRKFFTGKKYKATPFVKLCIEFFAATITIFPLASLESYNRITEINNQQPVIRNLTLADPSKEEIHKLVVRSKHTQVPYKSLTDYYLKMVTGNSLFSLFYMAFLSGALAYLLYTISLKFIEASEVGIFTYLQPVFTIPAAFLLLQEVPSSIFIVGSIIIGIGVYLAETRRKLVN